MAHKLARRRRRRRRLNVGRFVVSILIVIALVIGIFFAVRYFTTRDRYGTENPNPTPMPTPFVQHEDPVPAEQGATAAAVAGTQPSAFGFETDIMQNGQIVDSYERIYPVSFSAGSEYTDVVGITTFRGNNYRNTASYGSVNVTEGVLSEAWSIQSGSLGSWTGSGWTGQPLIVQWPAEMREVMNLHPEKKDKENLVEVIYPTMDGYIYFLDLEDGKPTRDKIEMGYSVKGTATLDPRGYPLLYVGQGIGMSGGHEWDDTYMRIYSLVDGKELYRYGAEMKDEFSHRISWQAYDSSPLVCADADTLVWPGENGVLYTFRLNSNFDISTGSVSVSPEEPVKYRYTTPLNGDDEGPAGTRWYGMENSAAAFENYLYFTDNGGWLQCVDLNTMELVWAQDVLDDSDCTIVLEPEGDNVYLYTATQVDKQITSEDQETGTAYIRKINALNGEIVWEVPHTCFYYEGVAGGILASPVLGAGDMDGLVIFAVARTGESEDEGLLVAYNKDDGSVAWQTSMDRYAWSSPVAIYTSEGKGYLLQCDNGGMMHLIEGATGAVIDSFSLEYNVEASPAVFGNIAVVGTRGERIFGVRIE